MNRIRSLSVFQKIILIILAAMVVVFCVLYPLTMKKEGFYYVDGILTPSETAAGTVYSGKIRGNEAEFTVSADKTSSGSTASSIDKTVVFRCGEKTYGPYTVKEDPSLVPAENPIGSQNAKMQGVEIRCRDEVIFRGFSVEYGDGYMLFDENGQHEIDVKIIIGGGATAHDESGNELDYMEPSANDVFRLASGPALSHKGNVRYLLGGIAICIMAALTVIFARELFLHQARMTVADAKDAEPSGWFIVSRYISWIVLTLAALMIFIGGLKSVVS